MRLFTHNDYDMVTFVDKEEIFELSHKIPFPGIIAKINYYKGEGEISMVTLLFQFSNLVFPEEGS